jgi:hypothetical protein
VPGLADCMRQRRVPRPSPNSGLPLCLASSVIRHFGVDLMTRACGPTAPLLTSLAGNFCSRLLFSGYRCASVFRRRTYMEAIMNGLIYLVGLIVVVLFILSFLGLR